MPREAYLAPLPPRHRYVLVLRDPRAVVVSWNHYVGAAWHVSSASGARTRGRSAFPRRAERLARVGSPSPGGGGETLSPVRRVHPADGAPVRGGRVAALLLARRLGAKDAPVADPVGVRESPSQDFADFGRISAFFARNCIKNRLKTSGEAP